ncbi:MAG: hypothetical protein AAGE05_14690 [Pseudomonadota bacterium]
MTETPRKPANDVSDDPIPIDHHVERGSQLSSRPAMSPIETEIEVEDSESSGRYRIPNLVYTQGAQFIKNYLKARREREWQFPNGLFSDPAWDILLGLYVAQSEQRPIQASAIGAIAAVSQTSGQRWLKILRSRQLVTCEKLANDAGDPRVTLTLDAVTGLNRWLDRMSPLIDSDIGEE